ncbi:hypothetical protein QO010_003103 [Caulobacter ginsengisoli]|uniref:Tail specific protease domain-containing protein n=1 Tax=Caulobacter ginsengisoli TaxID=400775 RepID=A0ABU0IVE6_9CAUL|nr:S41 family peptidase [Caulobacter ginsengisoli]MDQ0465316.1 hypothetical protein [Caulobacter ginsengisoli]
MKRLLLAAALALTLSGPALAAGFDRAAWQADFVYLKTELEGSYSHLAWMASPQSGIDLPALNRRAERQLAKATSDAEAADAIRAFVAGLHDGHLSELPTLKPAPPADPPAKRDLTRDDARTGCAALGYAHRTSVAFSAPFEGLAGFRLLEGDQVFRAGLLPLPDGRTLGFVRIPRFRGAEFPELCQQAWAAILAKGETPSRGAIGDRMDDLFLQALAARLKSLEAAGAVALVVDIGGNGGGNDLGDWAARLFTDRPVKSAPLLMVDSPVSVGYFDEQIEGLKAAKPSPAVDAALKAFEAGKAVIGKQKACSRNWVWREQRAWGADLDCAGLLSAGFASGASQAIDPEPALYWPIVAQPYAGAWTGPVYLLTNSGTASAAEMFAAVMRDNAIARTIGAKTSGLGCGFMGDGETAVLPNSRLRFQIPNCVRLRGDGTDEVAGISPDLPILPAEGESEAARAWRIVRTIAGDLSRG